MRGSCVTHHPLCPIHDRKNGTRYYTASTVPVAFGLFLPLTHALLRPFEVLPVLVILLTIKQNVFAFRVRTYVHTCVSCIMAGAGNDLRSKWNISMEDVGVTAQGLLLVFASKSRWTLPSRPPPHLERVDWPSRTLLDHSFLGRDVLSRNGCGLSYDFFDAESLSFDERGVGSMIHKSPLLILEGGGSKLQ